MCLVISIVLSGGCLLDGKFCLCSGDKVINDVTSDGGYLMDKNTLPVTAIHIANFAESGDNVTLGPVECYGVANNPEGRLVLS